MNTLRLENINLHAPDLTPDAPRLKPTTKPIR